MALFPHAEGTAQQILLLVLYSYFIFKGSKLLADGSDILRDIYGAGIVGGIIIPILGALPDGFIVIFSGLAAGTHEEIQNRLNVGIGALAGATVMLITVPLCIGVFIGSRQLDEEGRAMSEYQPIAEGSNKLILKPVPPARFSLFENGVTALPSTPRAARWMVLTCVTFLVIQIPAFFYHKDPDGGTHNELIWACIGVGLATVLFFAYLIVMWRDADSAEMVEERRQRVHKFMAWSAENKSLIGALDPVTLFNILDKDGDGLLDAEDLRLGFKTMGLTLNHTEAQAFFNMMDADGNIAVDINEFVNFVREFILTADPRAPAPAGEGGADAGTVNLDSALSSLPTTHSHAAPSGSAAPGLASDLSDLAPPRHRAGSTIGLLNSSVAPRSPAATTSRPGSLLPGRSSRPPPLLGASPTGTPWYSSEGGSSDRPAAAADALLQEESIEEDSSSGVVPSRPIAVGKNKSKSSFVNTSAPSNRTVSPSGGTTNGPTAGGAAAGGAAAPPAAHTPRGSGGGAMFRGPGSVRRPGTYVLAPGASLLAGSQATSQSGSWVVGTDEEGLESMPMRTHAVSTAAAAAAAARAAPGPSVASRLLPPASAVGGSEIDLEAGIPATPSSLGAAANPALRRLASNPAALSAAPLSHHPSSLGAHTFSGGSPLSASAAAAAGAATPKFARVEHFARVLPDGANETPVEIYAQAGRTDDVVVDRSQPPPPLPVALMEAVLAWFNDRTRTAPALVRAGLRERYALHAWAARTGVLGHISDADPLTGERVLKLVKLVAPNDAVSNAPHPTGSFSPATGISPIPRTSNSFAASARQQQQRRSSRMGGPAAEWVDLSLPRWASASIKLLRYVRNTAEDARILGLTVGAVGSGEGSEADDGLEAVPNVNFPTAKKAYRSNVVVGSSRPRSIHDVFAEADVNAVGALTVADVIAFAEKFKLNVSTVAIKVRFHTYDSDLDRTLSLPDFRKFLEDLVTMPAGPEAEAADAAHRRIENVTDEEIVAAHGHMSEVTMGWSEAKKRNYGIFLLVFGMSMVAFFSDPMIEVITDLGESIGVRPFYISFIVTPFASNAAEVIAALMFARSRTNVSMALTLSSLYGAVTMNNTLCVAIFLAILAARGLAWRYTAEVMTIIIVQVVVAFMVRGETIRQWQALVIGLMFPIAIVLVYSLELVFNGY